MAENNNNWKWIFTIVAIPLGMEVFSELAFTFTDWGSELLYGLADTFNLEGGIHGAEAGAHAGHARAHNSAAVGAAATVPAGTCSMIDGAMVCA